MKASHGYAVQVSDTTMMNMAASLPEQYCFNKQAALMRRTHFIISNALT